MTEREKYILVRLSEDCSNKDYQDIRDEILDLDGIASVSIYEEK